MPNAVHAHVGRLVQTFPEVQVALDEHVHDYDELLAHVFYDDVTRWFLDRLAANDERAAKFVRWLEGELEGADESIDNLIGVSFLEMLPWPPHPDAERIAAALDPRLRQELRAMQEWRPSAEDRRLIVYTSYVRPFLKLYALAIGLAVLAGLGLIAVWRRRRRFL